MFDHISSKKKRRYILLSVYELILAMFAAVPLIFIVVAWDQKISTGICILIFIYEVICVLIGIPLWDERWKIAQNKE